MEEETVIVVPIVKGGQPIVSGLATSDPLMVWRNAMGKITNVFADALEGSDDLMSEYLSFGEHLWRYATTYWNLNDSEQPLMANLKTDVW